MTNHMALYRNSIIDSEILLLTFIAIKKINKHTIFEFAWSGGFSFMANLMNGNSLQQSFPYES